MAEPVVRLEGTTWRPKTGPFRLGPMDTSAAEGRFIALIGPNGAGKSTVLNLVAGILEPHSGRVELFGRNPGSWSARDRGRRLSILAQDPERPFGFPVRDYISLGRYPHIGPFGSAAPTDRRIVSEELERWGLTELSERSIRSLSGGEFQRVRLARALCQQPKLLLLDEPGNHLDLSNRYAILERLRREAAGNRCVMAVLHDVNDALLFADDVWLFDRGRIVASGSPETVLTPEHLSSVYDCRLQTYRHPSGASMLGAVSRSSQD